jgi:hypothetical protein
MAKKVTNRNLGPEMAKKAYEAGLNWKGVIDPWEEAFNKKQKPTGDSTKVKVVPGKTRIGPLAGGGPGGMFGTKNR